VKIIYDGQDITQSGPPQGQHPGQQPPPQTKPQK
jgi:hypothetical protein